MTARQQSGFTLVEMLTVLGILGVVLATAASSLSRVLPAWRVRQAALEVASNLRAARAKAVLDHAEVNVPFDPARLRYALLARGGAERSGPGDDSTRVAYLPQGVTFTEPTGAEAITLDPPGSETQAATFTARGLLRSDSVPGYVHLGNATHGVYWRVAVNSIGIVTVQRLSGGAWK